MPAVSSWHTRANALTAVRLLAAPALFAAIGAGEAWIATALYALAVATDFADGRVARRRGTTRCSIHRRTDGLGATGRRRVGALASPADRRAVADPPHP